MSDTPGGDKDLSDVQNVMEEAPVKGNYAGDIPLDELLYGEANALTPEEIKKIKQVLWGTFGVILMVVVLSIFACQPKTGPMAFGICSTFLEMNTPYPNTLDLTELEGSRTALRIYFTAIDPFGEFKQEMMECTFGPDEAGGMKLTQVTRNRRPVDPAIVAEFNKTLPIIMASDPYLVLPPEWKNQLIQDREP